MFAIFRRAARASARFVATAACPTCGDTDLDVDVTELPTGADRCQRAATVVVGCSGCGFAAERRPDGFAVLAHGTRELGFDKPAYRRRLAAIAALSTERLAAETAGRGARVAGWDD